MTEAVRQDSSSNSVVTADRWVLAERVLTGIATESNFRRESAVLPPLQQGDVLIRTTYVSLDPHTAGEIGPIPEGALAKAQAQLMPPVEVGAHVRGYALGEVIESRDPSISPGEVVQGYWGWQTVVTGRLSSEGADMGFSFAVDGSIYSAVTPILPLLAAEFSFSDSVAGLPPLKLQCGTRGSARLDCGFVAWFALWMFGQVLGCSKWGTSVDGRFVGVSAADGGTYGASQAVGAHGA
jgi:hypothetical protein